MKDKGYPHGKAAALLAYALDIESQDSPDLGSLNRLCDKVCEDERERIRLLSLLSTSQNPHLPEIVLELLGARLDRLKDRVETAEDMDTVFGAWGQRLAGGALLASIGFVATGLATGGWAVLVLGAAFLSGGVTSYGRHVLKRRGRASRRAVEQTERLCAALDVMLKNKGARKG